jgi:hypothetical protein
LFFLDENTFAAVKTMYNCGRLAGGKEIISEEIEVIHNQEALYTKL